MRYVHHVGAMLKVRAGERAGNEQTEHVQRSKSCGAVRKMIKGLLTAQSCDIGGAKGVQNCSMCGCIGLHKRKFHTILIRIEG